MALEKEEYGKVKQQATRRHYDPRPLFMRIPEPRERLQLAKDLEAERERQKNQDKTGRAGSMGHLACFVSFCQQSLKSLQRRRLATIQSQSTLKLTAKLWQRHARPQLAAQVYRYSVKKTSLRRVSKSPRSKRMHLKRELGYSPAATNGSSNEGNG